MILNNTHIEGFEGLSSSAISASGKSILILQQNTTVKNMTCYFDGFFLHTPSIFIMDNVTFEDIGDINVKQMSGEGIKITNSNFYAGIRNTQGIIKIEDSHALFDNVLFEKKKTSTEIFEANAIQVKYNSRITVNNCTFKNLSYKTGGAIFINANQEANISNSIFENNSAVQGGAIYIMNTDIVTILDSTFKGNEAKIGLYKVPNTSQTYTGGAIFIHQEIQNGGCDQCQTIFNGKNFFENNYAYHAGAAIAYSSNGFVDEGNIFKNNKAEKWNQDVTSYISQISFNKNDFIGNMIPISELADGTQPVFTYYKELLDLLLQNFELDFHNSGKLGLAFEFPSGQGINLEVLLQDTDGSTNLDNDIGELQMDLITLEDYLYERNVTFQIQKQIEPTIVNNKQRAKRGVINMSSLIITQLPTSLCIVKFMFTQGIPLNGIEKDFIVNPPTFLVYSRPCISGEEYTQTGNCQVCLNGYYLIVPPTSVTQCKPCPENASCFGSNKITPNKGSFRSSLTSLNTLICLNPSACLGGQLSNLQGSCAEGYNGMLCNSCDTQNGWYKASWNTCNQCTATNNLLAFFQLVWICLTINFIIRLNKQYVLRKQQKQNLAFVNQIKLMINHCVIILTLSNIEYNYSEIVRQINKFQGQIVYIMGKILTFECVVIQFSEDYRYPVFFRELILGMFSPLLIMMFNIFMISFLKCCDRKFQIFDTNRLITLFVITIYLCQPDIVHRLLASLACRRIEGKFRLLYDPDIICWEGTHLDFILTFTIPGIIIYMIIFPILFLWMIYKSRQAFKDFQKYDAFSKVKQFQLEMVVERYGFLTSGLKENFWFWDIVIMYKKFIVIFSVEYLRIVSNKMQVLVCILFTLFSTLLTFQYKPYQEQAANDLSIKSEVIQLISLYFGCIYQTNYNQPFLKDQESFFQWMVAFMILIPSLQFFFSWAKTIVINLLSIVHKTNIKFFRLFTLNMIDQNKFKAQYMEEKELEIVISSSSDNDNQDKKNKKLDFKDIGVEMDEDPFQFRSLFDGQKLNSTDLKNIQIVQQRINKYNSIQIKQEEKILKLESDIRKKTEYSKFGITIINQQVKEAVKMIKETEKTEMKLNKIRERKVQQFINDGDTYNISQMNFQILQTQIDDDQYRMKTPHGIGQNNSILSSISPRKPRTTVIDTIDISNNALIVEPEVVMQPSQKIIDINKTHKQIIQDSHDDLRYQATPEFQADFMNYLHIDENYGTRKHSNTSKKYHGSYKQFKPPLPDLVDFRNDIHNLLDNHSNNVSVLSDIAKMNSGVCTKQNNLDTSIMSMKSNKSKTSKVIDRIKQRKRQN